MGGDRISLSDQEWIARQEMCERWTFVNMWLALFSSGCFLFFNLSLTWLIVIGLCIIVFSFWTDFKISYHFKQMKERKRRKDIIETSLYRIMSDTSKRLLTE